MLHPLESDRSGAGQSTRAVEFGRLSRRGYRCVGREAAQMMDARLFIQGSVGQLYHFRDVTSIETERLSNAI